MLTITKHGNTIPKKYKKLCPRCHCEFEYEAGDALIDLDGQFTEHWDGLQTHEVLLCKEGGRYKYVSCPECGTPMPHILMQRKDIVLAAITDAANKNEPSMPDNETYMDKYKEVRKEVRGI